MKIINIYSLILLLLVQFVDLFSSNTSRVSQYEKLLRKRAGCSTDPKAVAAIESDLGVLENLMQGLCNQGRLHDLNGRPSSPLLSFQLLNTQKKLEDAKQLVEQLEKKFQAACAAIVQHRASKLDDLDRERARIEEQRAALFSKSVELSSQGVIDAIFAMPEESTVADFRQGSNAIVQVNFELTKDELDALFESSATE